MSNNAFNEWMDEAIWPEVISLLLNDSYFKLVRYVSELTQTHIDPIEWLVLNGYVVFQIMSIRRLCDTRKDAISLHRLLTEGNISSKNRLLQELDACSAVCAHANDHIAHNGNPSRRPKITDWNLSETDLTNAQKAICKVTMELDRYRTKPRGYVKIFPAVGLDMRQFKLSPSDTQRLWDFWHAHSDLVNSWIV